MDDEKFNELYDVLNQFKQAIDFLKAENDALKEQMTASEARMGELETTLFEKIIKPTEAAVNEEGFQEFHNKYGEKLDPYNDKLRALEGDEDFDLSRRVYDDFKEYEAPEGMEPYTEEEYVEAVMKQVEDQIDTVRAKLGVADNEPLEIKQDEDGNTEISSNGETLASGETETVTDEKSETEETTTEDDEQPSLPFDEEEASEETDTPSEEEEKEIKEELAKYKSIASF